MISVIISSVFPEQLKKVSKNIEETIGVPFELIAFANGSGEKGVCEIYNLGMEKAQYKTLCFMHEDVEIKTKNWGKAVIDHFDSDPKLGLLGIAGSTYKPLTPTGWHGIGSSTPRVNYIQSFKKSNKPSKHYYINPNNEQIAQVACVDGVWFCTTKKIASEFKFDDTTFKKFHGYDLDFSLAVGQKYKVAITYSVLLEHFSEGTYDNTWMEETLKLHAKWSEILPVNIGNAPLEAVIKIEKSTFKEFIKQMLQLNYPIKAVLEILANCRSYFRLKPFLVTKLKYYIFSTYIRKRQVG